MGALAGFSGGVIDPNGRGSARDAWHLGGLGAGVGLIVGMIFGSLMISDRWEPVPDSRWRLGASSMLWPRPRTVVDLLDET